MKLKKIMIGEDFRVKESKDNRIWCYVGLNEDMDAVVVCQEFERPGGAVVNSVCSLPTDTEVVFVPRNIRTQKFLDNKTLETMSIPDLELLFLELKKESSYFFRINDILTKKKRKKESDTQQYFLKNLKESSKFKECEYPSMDFEGLAGHAEFIDKEQALTLIELLNKNSSYYYTYSLDWNECGCYSLNPSYDYDHDGEMVYYATFKKK